MLRFCRTKKLESRKHEVTVHMGNSLLEESIEVLGLSVRSFNCLRRCGLMTIGDVVGKIEGEEDLLKIRNLGRKSAQEIMEKVERYQQLLLDQEKTVDSTQHL